MRLTVLNEPESSGGTDNWKSCQLSTTGAGGLSVGFSSVDTGVSDGTSGAFTIIIPDSRAY